MKLNTKAAKQSIDVFYQKSKIFRYTRNQFLADNIWSVVSGKRLINLLLVMLGIFPKLCGCIIECMWNI